MSPRLKKSRLFKPNVFLTCIGLVVVLSGCTNLVPVDPVLDSTPLTAAFPNPDVVGTLSLKSGDKITLLEKKLNGKVLNWQPSEQYATLGFTQKAADDLPSSAGVQLEPNLKSFLGGGTPAIMNGQFGLWSDGRSGLWLEGRSGLWLEGVYQVVPENTTTWAQVKLEAGQSLAPTLGAGVKVAIIDTGIDLAHSAFAGILAPAEEQWDFVGNDNVPQEEGTMGVGGYGHGTNVAGIIRQIAPKATILPIRVLDSAGEGRILGVAAGIEWAIAKGAKIINLSLGGSEFSMSINRAINHANNLGIFVVTSVGNDDSALVNFPGNRAYERVERVSVASVDSNDYRSSFSNFGWQVEVAAPGSMIYGPAPENRLAAWSGTSQATPMVAGTLALALGQKLKPSITRNSLAEELMIHSSPVLQSTMFRQLGRGRLDIEAFLNWVVAK
jgi:subtilisin family serine protease